MNYPFINQFIRIGLVSFVFLVSCAKNDELILNDELEVTSSKNTVTSQKNSNSSDMNLASILHYNINVRDFSKSRKFYELLGFVATIDLNINVTDPEEAQGLNLPPYSLKTTPLVLFDRFVIDLIKFNDPYDDAPPHTDETALGISTLSLKSSCVWCDMKLLKRNGYTYELLAGNSLNPKKIRVQDPDGNIIYIHQVYDGNVPNIFGKGSVNGLYSTNINVSDLGTAIEFYSEIGFEILSMENGVADIGLRDGRKITLTESDSELMPYEKLNHLGIARIAINSDDLDSDIAALHAKGIQTYSPEAIKPTGPFSFIRYVAFEDPDGTVIELVQNTLF
ncbi:VOC family protein [Tenacibaculum sp. 190524A05c]|uniref:VOC family protein n=1 Tax=Tenacibaculum platacis TaxID=3137852 RepID=UPI0032B1EB0C